MQTAAFRKHHTYCYIRPNYCTTSIKPYIGHISRVDFGIEDQEFRVLSYLSKGRADAIIFNRLQKEGSQFDLFDIPIGICYM